MDEHAFGSATRLAREIRDRRLGCLELLEATVAAIARAGALVGENARPDIGEAEHHRLFMTLSRAATASRLSDADFAAQKDIAATIAPDDMSFRATLARGATLDHRAWGIANEARNKLRYALRDDDYGGRLTTTTLAGWGSLRLR